MGVASQLFDRQFAPGDEIRFSQLVAGLVGQECIAWRKSYGSTGSLHFGQLIAKRAPPPKAVHKDRGTWVLWLWACNQKLTFPGGEQLDSTRDGDDVVLARMPELVGSAVRGIRIDPNTLSLTLELSTGATLELITDPTYDGDEEQWDLKLPNERELTAWRGRRWALQEDE